MADNQQADELEFLGKILVDIGLLSPEQRETAVAKIAGDDLIASLLDLLSRSHAIWSPPGNPSKTLTDYQRRRIQKCRESGNYSRLKQILRWERKSKKSGLSQFLVLEPLGKGGMGVVYKCWDVRRQMYVAVKRSKYENPKTARRSIEIVRQRLRREAKIQGLLEHPNIARYIDFLKGARSDLLVLEYVDGKTLFDLVESRSIPWKIVAGWAVALLDALAHAHGRGVVHRDIKPKNIILQKTPGGYVAKLLDMGLAKSIGATAALGNTLGGELTAAGVIIGSAAFMPPEQWASATDATDATDIYALGCTLFFALAGRVPFEAEDAAGYCFGHTQIPPPSIRDHRPDVPAPFDLILKRMMDKSPPKRGAAGELRSALAKVLEQKPTDVPEPARPRQPNRKKAISTVPAPQDQADTVFSGPALTSRRPAPTSSVGPSEPARVSTMVLFKLAWLSGAASLQATLPGKGASASRGSRLQARMLRREFGQALVQWLRAAESPHRSPIRLVQVSSILVALTLVCVYSFGMRTGGIVAGMVAAGLLLPANLLRLFGPKTTGIVLAFAGGLLALIRWAI